jgi:hypothetical protein
VVPAQAAALLDRLDLMAVRCCANCSCSSAVQVRVVQAQLVLVLGVVGVKVVMDVAAEVGARCSRVVPLAVAVTAVMVL